MGNMWGFCVCGLLTCICVIFMHMCMKSKVQYQVSSSVCHRLPSQASAPTMTGAGDTTDSGHHCTPRMPLSSHAQCRAHRPALLYLFFFSFFNFSVGIKLNAHAFKASIFY